MTDRILTKALAFLLFVAVCAVVGPVWYELAVLALPLVGR